MSNTEGRWEQLWLPLWPLASDDLRTGIYRTSRDDALTKRYIEANPLLISNLLVVDIDHSDAVIRALWNRHQWLPNAVVENPSNGHAHAVWALAEPVTRTEYARRKPLAFAAAVTEGLRRSVDGDAAYSGLITKNPEHTAWNAKWVTDHLYSLDELSHHLTQADYMPAKSWNRTRRKNPEGLGRNCALFETARHWAYREIRHHFGNPQSLKTAIEFEAHAQNAEFANPLPANEVHHLAMSIWRWITTRSRMWKDGPAVYEATYTLIQSNRAQRRGQKTKQTFQEVLDGCSIQ